MFHQLLADPALLTGLTLLADPSGPTVLAEGNESYRALGVAPFVIGPMVFFLVYLGIYRYYRNTDKSHDFERQTVVESFDMRAFDEFAQRRTGLRNAEIEGRNEDAPRERVRRFDLG